MSALHELAKALSNLFALSRVEPILIEAEQLAALGQGMNIQYLDGCGDLNKEILHELWTPEVCAELAMLGRDMVRSHPEARFFGIGHSPSYLIFAMKELTRECGEKLDAAYIPFSKRYLLPVSEDMDKCAAYQYATEHFNYGRYVPAMRRNKGRYRFFLMQAGLRPNNILGNFQQKGRQTVVIDNFQGGSSYTSFVHFMHCWAKEEGISKREFSEAFKIVALTDEPIPPVVRIAEDRFAVKIYPVAISFALRKALNGNWSEGVDRFVPAYSPKQWDKPVGPVVGNEPYVDLVKGLVRGAVRRAVSPTQLGI